MREPILRLALELMCRTRLDVLAKKLVRPRGVVFALHRVKPAEIAPFAPNHPLEVSPEFLEATIDTVRQQGFRFVALDDIPSLLAAPAAEPFAAVTLDDAYRDNKEHAWPVFRRHRVPFTIFVPSAFADGSGQIWWVELERAIAALDAVPHPAPGSRPLPARSSAEKQRAFRQVYWRLRAMDEGRARLYVRRLCREAGIEVRSLCRDLIMSWDELREMAADPLVSFGAHTVEHRALAKLTEAEACEEMGFSRARLEAELGRPCLHFCYPYGDASSAGAREFRLAAELGFKTALTMRKSLLSASHASELAALPRCSLNGDYQSQRYVRALLTGVPFKFWQAAEALTPIGRPLGTSGPLDTRGAAS